MKKFTSQIHFVRIFLFSLLLLSGLFAAGNAYSLKRWNREYMMIAFDPALNAFVIKMMYFDYIFGPFGEHGYLEHCKFQFSDDGVNYHTLLEANTENQKEKDWSWIYFSNKYPGAQLSFFYETNIGEHKTNWKNEKNLRLETSHPHRGTQAWIAFNWYMNQDIKNIKTIRVVGKWYITIRYESQSFDYIAYKAKNRVTQKLNSYRQK